MNIFFFFQSTQRVAACSVGAHYRHFRESVNTLLNKMPPLKLTTTSAKGPVGPYVISKAILSPMNLA
ncbi:hypothetical protein WH50_16390 [Pokkaliibacter plantistimulans]|uniref:Uncharacterized protein n=1 Tax=Pokkaliibacter plantistimulans TaxID=1635171 RepID=A0ABX5LTX1_9GAMM|nr:hypothetical protein WH50_16390 [Pokkaliibacter plantistimulans]